MTNQIDEGVKDEFFLLKSFIEHKPDNLFYGIINRNPNKIINSTVNSLCGQPIRWGED